MAELRPHVDEIRAAGGDLVVVGTGAPHFARAFVEDLALGDLVVLCDTEARAYALAGFKRGMATFLHPRGAVNYMRALSKGFRQARTQGHSLQQGGVLVVRPDGTIAFRFVSEASGDHPPVADVVAAVRGAA